MAVSYKIIDRLSELKLQSDTTVYTFENVIQSSLLYSDDNIQNVVLYNIYASSRGKVILAESVNTAKDKDGKEIEINLPSNLYSSNEYVEAYTQKFGIDKYTSIQMRIKGCAVDYANMIDDYMNYFYSVGDAFKEFKENCSALGDEFETDFPKKEKTKVSKIEIKKADKEETIHFTKEDTPEEREEKKKKLKEARDKRNDEYMAKRDSAYEKTQKFITLSIKWTSYLTQIIAELTDVIRDFIPELQKFIEGTLKEAESLAKELTAEMIQRLMNNPYIAVLTVKMKKFLLICEKFLLKCEYWINDTILIPMLEMAKNGKFAASMASTYSALIASAKATAEVTDKVMQAITNVIALIPAMFAVPAEGMSFFFTPKTVGVASQMAISNLHKSTTDYLNDAIRVSIESIQTQDKTINSALKGSYIASCVAASQIGGFVNLPAFPIENISASPSSVIIGAIDLLLMLLPNANPMPKYEKLNILNIGWMVFLMTGWCKAGQFAFGFPGIFQGSAATELETTDFG